MERTLAREQVGEELAEQQQDQPDMHHPKAGLAGGEAKAPDLRRDEIEDQHPADKIATREDGDSPRGALRPPVNDEAAEELILGLVQAQIHLRQGAPKDQHQAQRQAHNRQAQRREEADQAIQKMIKGHVNSAFPAST